MNEKTYKVKVSVSLDEVVIDQIRMLAEQEDRSFSQYINLVLKDWLKRKNKSESAD